ncbi:hypothetical protein FRC01_002248 [Tulasnella sp. 417]|nr:hypothetical protein FRC01_002248 [Tulasnella sp. 417]
MHGSAASAVRPPIPLEPPTNTTLSELNRNGGETFGFIQTPYRDPQMGYQNLSASLVRLENVRAQLAESMDGLERARNATATHERTMAAMNGDQMVSSMFGGAVEAAYGLIRERQGAGGSFTTVRPGPRGPEIMVLPPRTLQAPGGGPTADDDGFTLRGRRVMANQALAGSSSRQNDPQQNQANGQHLQVVLTSINGSLASFHGRQVPPSSAGADTETTPLLQNPPRDISSPSATPPTVVQISTPTTAESSHRADSTSPRPPYPPVQAYTIIERTPSPVPPLVYPFPPLPNIRHVFDHTGAAIPTPVVPVPNGSTPIVLSRGVSPASLAPYGEVRQAGEFHQLLLDQPRRVRRRLDDSGGSVEVPQYSPSPPPFIPRYPDPTNSRPRSPTPLSDADFRTLRGWEVVYPSAYPSSPPTGPFVPPGITDSTAPTPRVMNRSPIRPVRRAWRREDSNGDEVISDDEETAARERQQQELRRRSRLMSRSTTNLNDPYEALADLARLDSDNQAVSRRDESADQEKHNNDGSGDAVMSGPLSGSAGSSRPGSRGSSRSFNMNFTGAGEGEIPLFPCPLPIHPSEMVSKSYRPARDWKTRFTPPPPLHGSVARARAIAHAKGSRRPARRYGDPVGR